LQAFRQPSVFASHISRNGRTMRVPTKVERIADLDTPLSSLYPASMPDDFEKVRLTIQNGPNLRFNGALLINEAPLESRTRHDRFQLYAIEGGGFVAAHGWISTIPGENNFWSAAEVQTVRDVMAAWKWCVPAKGLAKVLQWDIAEYLGSAKP